MINLNKKKSAIFSNADSFWLTYLAVKANKFATSKAVIGAGEFFGIDAVKLRRKSYDLIKPPTAKGCQREILDMGKGDISF